MTPFYMNRPFIVIRRLTASGRWLIFVILKNPFLHTGPSDFKISIAVIGNSRPLADIQSRFPNGNIWVTSGRSAIQK
jgi:hypothetical protein